jgi:hypothetical protein
VNNFIFTFCNKLAQLKCDDFVVESLYELVDIVDDCEDISDTYESIFNFLERNPTSDIGSPGPLVHLLEKHFPSYVPNLIKSLESAPSINAIFMLHRIMNSSITKQERQIYLGLLNDISINKSYDVTVCKEAKEYCDYHSAKYS